MCARFSLAVPTADIERLLDVSVPEDVAPRANIAPTMDVPAAVMSPVGRDFRMLRWGLVPFWADGPSIGQKLINARAETAPEKPAFRECFRKRRCVIPADGFYEWRDEPLETGLDLGLEPSPKSGKTYKQPYRFSLRSGQPFVFAGLFDNWKSPSGEWWHTFTMLTTEPSPLVASFHDRMPCILTCDQIGSWLDQNASEPAELMPLLASVPESELNVEPVDPKINNPRYEPYAL